MHGEIYILLDRYKEAKDMMTCYQQLNPRLKCSRDDHDAYMERLERYINHKLGEEEGAFELLRSRQKVIVSKAKQKRRLTVRRQRALRRGFLNFLWSNGFGLPLNGFKRRANEW